MNILFGILILYLSNLYIIWDCSVGAHLYSFSFAIGVLLSYLNSIKVNKNKRNIFLTILELIIFIFYLCTYNTEQTRLCYCFYSILFPLFLIIFFDLRNIKLNKYIELFGKYSYDIYLWEGFFLFKRDLFFNTFKIDIIMDLVSLIVIILVAINYRKMIINPVEDYLNKKDKK